MPTDTNPTELFDLSDEDVLVLIDLHCFMHRFWATMQGRFAHGFIGFLANNIRHRQPSHIAICTDLPHPTFRADLYPKTTEGTGYKAHREPPDATLLERLRWSREMSEDVFGVPVYGRKGFEADDLIGALTKQAQDAGMRVVILGLDKDLSQLVGDTCVMWDGKKAVTGSAEVEARLKVKPFQVRDYLAIVGDKADNVPGVHGLGPVAAVDILEEFVTLNEALKVACSAYENRLYKANPHYRKALRAGKASAELSQRLVELAYDAPVTLDRAALKRI